MERADVHLRKTRHVSELLGRQRVWIRFVSDRLKAAARKSYGHAGLAFLHRLTRDKETNFSASLEAIKMMPEFTPAGDDGQSKRAPAAHRIGRA